MWPKVFLCHATNKSFKNYRMIGSREPQASKILHMCVLLMYVCVHVGMNVCVIIYMHVCIYLPISKCVWMYVSLEICEQMCDYICVGVCQTGPAGK